MSRKISNDDNNDGSDESDNDPKQNLRVDNQKIMPSNHDRDDVENAAADALASIILLVDGVVATLLTLG